MKDRKIVDPDLETNGAIIRALVEEMKGIGTRVLERHGITELSDSKWYPMQAVLDSVAEVAEYSGQATLNAIGRRVIEVVKFPDHVKSLDSALASLDSMSRQVHRGSGVGYWSYESTGAQSRRLACSSPFPCDLTLGVVQALAEAHAPGGVKPVVTHETDPPCRDKGGRSCFYRVEW